jgi:hypothetical protein
MKQIPYLGLPASEQDAVLRIIDRAGIPRRGVCVSRVELAAPDATTFTAVSTPRWCRTYACSGGSDWIADFAHETGIANA